MTMAYRDDALHDHVESVELTILMPCLNEARTLAACIADAQSFARTSGLALEVLVADNGSTDGSPEIAQAAGARVIHVTQRGYGAALLGGIAAARGRFVIMGDADQSYDFANLSAFVERLRRGSDLVMGNRFAGGIEPGAMPWLHRYLGNPVLSFVGRLFFRVPVGDFHCGLRGFRRDAILHMGLVTPGMEFASEMVAKAALAKLKIDEVPTTLRCDGRDRPPHLRTWRDGWRHLRFLFLFCPRWLFLYPGVALAAVGLLGFVTLLRQTLILDRFALDIHSLLFAAAATVIGVQLVQLALLTKWVAVLAGLIATPKWIKFARKWISVELSLVCAALMFGVGFVWSASITLAWGEAGFAALDPRQVMRDAIPAVTLMMVGAQAAAAALFAAALRAAWPTPETRH